MWGLGSYVLKSLLDFVEMLLVEDPPQALQMLRTYVRRRARSSAELAEVIHGLIITNTILRYIFEIYDNVAMLAK